MTKKIVMKTNQSLTPEFLYKLGKLTEMSVEISKMITTEDFANNAFRYSKTIDYSGKGFDCQVAKSIYRILSDQVEKDHTMRSQYEKLVNMLLEFDIVVDRLKNDLD